MPDAALQHRRPERGPLYIVLLSIHGLVRGHDLELGRDADTGGQVKYVVELARALSERDDVERVDLLTRRVIDPQVSPDYGTVEEQLTPKARIVRIECGDAKYLRKELLWDCLENFSDNAFAYLKTVGRAPDMVHAHYADAGYVGTRLAHQLGVPLAFTGHSLGRNKLNQLLASGVRRSAIEATYNISRRIEAEEVTLGAAERIITSTQQEIEQQYGIYDYYQPELMRVIPPGIDLSQFFPPTEHEPSNNQEPCSEPEPCSGIANELKRFLKHPDKPMILAISRPDPKKNIVSLITAYGESPELQAAANLVIVAGNRDDVREMEDVTKGVMTDILLAVDRFDLYGKVAYPKHHAAEDIPTLFRLATTLRGAFVNPALTEPFGLTLIEAAACGLPIVATEDGGPRDIIKNCENGYLIDPLDLGAMTEALRRTLSDQAKWDQFSKRGIENVRQHYSWQSHVDSYISVIRPLIEKSEPIVRMSPTRRPGVFRERAVFASLDLNVIGDSESMPVLLKTLKEYRKTLVFGIATGRRFKDALTLLRRNNIPVPDVLISGQGTEIHYESDLTNDDAWQRHIDHWWNGQAVSEVLRDVPGLKLQPKSNQSEFQISYFIEPSVISATEVRQLLQRNEQSANVVVSFERFLDVLPMRASKGLALRWCAEQLGFPLENTLVAGVTASDTDMLLGNTLGTVVDNEHREELKHLENMQNVFFSHESFAAGILEAMNHYGFPATKMTSL